VSHLRPPLAAVVVALLVALAACGSDDSSSTSTDPASDPANAPAAGAASGAPGGQQPPGVSGVIAAATGKTLQVQSDQSGQVAVSWTAQTEITQQVAAALSDVVVGSCVAVGSDSTADAASVAATSVRISQPVEGSCQGGFTGGGGARPSGAPSGMPSDLPSEVPSGALDGARPGGGGAFGEVTAVTADGFTVQATQPGADAATAVAVTVAADTTYSTSAAADGTALALGRCVQAGGQADSTGALTATRISVTDSVEGSCTGLGGFGGPGGSS
jgi:uncharacterized protein DUF5666